MPKTGTPVTITNPEDIAGGGGGGGTPTGSAGTPTAQVVSVQGVSGGTPQSVQTILAAGTDRSGSATTTSGGLSVPANATRKGLYGQNLSTVNIGFNEFGGTAAIGTAGTYTVPPGTSFSISTNRLVNFIAASGTAAVTLTEF